MPASNGLELAACPFDRDNPVFPVRWGLAASCLPSSALLGAIAVLVTSVLGYLQAREALQ